MRSAACECVAARSLSACHHLPHSLVQSIAEIHRVLLIMGDAGGEIEGSSVGGPAFA